MSQKKDHDGYSIWSKIHAKWHRRTFFPTDDILADAMPIVSAIEEEVQKKNVAQLMLVPLEKKTKATVRFALGRDLSTRLSEANDDIRQACEILIVTRSSSMAYLAGPPATQSWTIGLKLDS